MSASSGPGQEVRADPAQGAGAAQADARALAARGVLCVRAGNPGPLTLTGTNTWLRRARSGVGGGPGPAARAPPARVCSTRSTSAAGSAGSRSRTITPTTPRPWRRCASPHPAPLAAATPRRGRACSPRACASARSRRLPRPGTPPITSRSWAPARASRGDAVLGAGSVFVSPVPRSDGGYLRGARATAHARGLRRPDLPRARPVRCGRRRRSSRSTSPTASTARTRLIAALADGRRTVERAARRGLVRTCRSRCGAPPRRRSRRTSTSSRRSRPCRRAWSGRDSSRRSGEGAGRGPGGGGTGR